MHLILVRHGQSQNNAISRYNRENNTKIKGFADSPLTPLGKAQAESVGKVVASLEPDVIASSALQRAIQTAVPAARLLDLPIDVCNNAHEVRLTSDYEGIDVDEMREKFPEAVFNEKDMVNNRWKFVSDENIERARERAANLIKSLQNKYAGKKVALFLHGNLNRKIFQSILGPETIDKIRIEQHNTCINQFTFKEDQTVIHRMGDVSHLIQDDVTIT